VPGRRPRDTGRGRPDKGRPPVFPLCFREMTPGSNPCEQCVTTGAEPPPGWQPKKHAWYNGPVRAPVPAPFPGNFGEEG
jgi:hypothetical protein